MRSRLLVFGACFLFALPAVPPIHAAVDEGNRLSYLDDDCRRYDVGWQTPKLVTPQWIGRRGVEAAIVLAVDDRGDPAACEAFLRPILERLRHIDGRAPLSIMSNAVDPPQAQVEVWRKGGAEIVPQTTPSGSIVPLDSSVFQLFTPADPELPRDLVFADDGGQRFAKYLPHDRSGGNYVRDYPYPFVIDKLRWELPSAIPDGRQGFRRQDAHHADTLRDLQAALDATVLKRGVFTLTFQPGAWMQSRQLIELIDHAVGRYGDKVMFLNFREVAERLTANLLGGESLRTTRGHDNGVRLADVNHDGFMDVIVANARVRQTRVWRSADSVWSVADFPVPIVLVGADGRRQDGGVRFGVLRTDGKASILVRNERTAGVWHFDGRRWVSDPQGLAGLDAVRTADQGCDGGARLRDLDGDGIGELIVGNPERSAAFRWRPPRGWERLPFGLPERTRIVDGRGCDAGLRFVDADVDSHPDVVFSDAERYGVYRFVSMASGWSQTMLSGRRGDAGEIPAIVRADGTPNGVWFQDYRMWLQNEATSELPGHVEMRHMVELLGTEREPPPRTPQEALASFDVLPGFRIELMAAEPLVVDPADLAWGPDGKLWVVEYRDYPLGLENKGIPCGRIRYLEDADGDGRYDRATTFLEDISCPMGIMVWRKGVLVTAAPEIFYAEDTDGDGRADVRQTLFTGFQPGNHQHRVNHPRWGLDNWVHAGNGDSGGVIRSLQTGEAVDINGRDLRFQPDEGRIEAQSGMSQFGTNRTDWGDWFGCNNSDPGYHYPLADHYMRRNPYVAPPPSRVSVARDRIVFPAGRVISHCDQQFGPPPGWGKPGHWTSLAGVMIYRDDLFGAHFSGNLFVGDSVFNVIHRRILRPDGVTFRGERGPDEQRREFLASHDIWFRSSTLETGPDGALWVLDFHRFVIEHPQWIADDLERTLDLRRGDDRGRIYRIYPVDKQPRPIPRLDRLDTAGLVAALDSPSGWQRDMAHQMLLWRGDRTAVGPLEQLVADCPRATARVHALCVLDGLQALRPEIAARAVADREAQVRRHAIRVSERLLNAAPTVGEAVLKREADEQPHVLMQLAYSLGEWDDPRAGALLGRLALRHRDDPYLTAAALSSATRHVDQMLAVVMADPGELSQRVPLVDTLLSVAVGMNNTKAVAGVLKSVTARPAAGYAAWQFRSTAQLLEGLAKQNLTLETLAEREDAPLRTALIHIDPLFQTARMLARDTDAAIADRVAALQILGRGAVRQAEDLELLAQLLSPQSPIELQLAAVGVMGRLRAGRVPDLLLRGWAEQSPQLNGAVLEVLLSRPEWTCGLLDRIEQDARLASILGTSRRDQLLRHPDTAVRRRAEQLLGRPASGEDIRVALEKFAAVTQLQGDPVRGKQVFVDATCADCHRLDGIGHEMAADLRTLVDKSPGALLIATIDPNRAVEDKFLEYTAITTSGLIRSGVLVEETTASVTLDDGGGKRYVILRRDLEELVNTGRSRMPEKLEAKLTLQQMADLFAFIASSGPPRRAVPGNQPATVTAEPDGSLHLQAPTCEIYAPGVTISGGDFLVWMYQGPNDHVIWSADVAKAGPYAVWIEYAQVDEYADNPIAVEAADGSSRVRAKLPSTGGWGRHQKRTLGTLHLASGLQRIRLRPDGPTAKEVADIRGLHLVPQD